MGIKTIEIPEDISEETGIHGTISLKSATLGNLKEINSIRKEIIGLSKNKKDYTIEDLDLLALERVLSAVVVGLPNGIDSVLDLDWQIIQWLLPIVEGYSLPLVVRKSSTSDMPSDTAQMMMQH